MKEVLLKAEAREVKSKHALKEIRAKGLIPATLYGKGEETQAVSVDAKSLLAIVKAEGANAVITLETAKGKKPAIIKELQRDMISQAPIHADFQAINLKNKIEVLVPLHIEGVAAGVKDFGGLMELLHREVKVSCLPTDVPKTISLDVTNLNIGDTVTVATLPKLDGVDYVQEADTLIVHIVAPKAEEEKPAEGAEAAAAPEVISKGKKDKEGEGVEAAAAKK